MRTARSCAAARENIRETPAALRSRSCKWKDSLSLFVQVRQHLGSQCRADMIVGKSPVLQKPCLLSLLRPAFGHSQPETADAQLAGALRPVLGLRQRLFDQRRVQAALREIALYAQRAVPALGTVGHELPSVAFVVEIAARNAFIDDALHRAGLETLRHQLLAQLRGAEVASCQQHYRGRTGHGSVGGLPRSKLAPTRSFPQHSWAASS